MKYVVLIIMIGICSSCDNLLRGYEEYPISPCEKAVNRVMARSAKELGHKYKMKPTAVTVGMPGGNIKYLALKFHVLGPVSKEKIRQLLLNMCHDFLSEINSDKPLLECLHGRKLSVKDVGITIFFDDKYRYPIAEPNIGIAYLIKGRLDYVKTDKEVFKYTDQQYETYEEALKIANESE